MKNGKINLPKMGGLICKEILMKPFTKPGITPNINANV